VDIEPDLIVWADESLLLIALVNLFGNAVKYSQNKAQPIIKLSGSTENKKTVFCIEDNGAGFNMDFASQLFHPFRRLHSEKEFPGSGIGLATTKRVLDWHNGEIWAESSPSQPPHLQLQGVININIVHKRFIPVSMRQLIG